MALYKFLSKDDAAILVLVTPQEAAEFRRLVARGVNTWDTAPAWVHKLHSDLEDTPQPYN